MTVYTFYLHDEQDAMPSFEIALFDSEDPAMAHARRLLEDRPRYKSVEITSGGDSVARLTRESL